MERLPELVDQGYSQREIAELCSCSQANVRYWLKKYGLKTKGTSNFQRVKSTTRLPKRPKTWYCESCKKPSVKKMCGSCRTKLRRRRQKQRAIDYLGGKCIICGFDKHPAALTFHHRDPSTKGFEVSKYIQIAWSRVVVELDKCDLLCANCHIIEHTRD